jgi:ABC-2 type transport system ATP-binding protein
VDTLPDLAGISDLKREDERLSFLFSRDVRELLRALSSLDITDVNITDPELDEVFMNYYVKEKK